MDAAVFNKAEACSAGQISAFRVGNLYAHEEIYRSLSVGNAGGIRPAIRANGNLARLVIFTTAPTAKFARENPYADRIEGDVLVYTAAGREGSQNFTGVNARIPDQARDLFPIYCFLNTASRRSKGTGLRRWEFLGLFAYQRHFVEVQSDARGEQRSVWVFEMRRIPVGDVVPIEHDRQMFQTGVRDVLKEPSFDNSPVAPSLVEAESKSSPNLEGIRRKMLAFTPQQFEHLVKHALERSGFQKVQVTRYSQDGGIDVEAETCLRLWPLRGTLVQVQAKRWIHTVGRKEIAELRGSLKNYARGTFVTTSHYSKSAVHEAEAITKVPIVLMDGQAFAAVIKKVGLLD
jgi:hypothetical protein